jgi:hypothetical protein
MKKISDLDLIKKIKKDNCEFSKVQLWTRYQPLVHKKSLGTFRYFKNYLSLNDIHQDMYLAFEKALKYFDIKKAVSPDFKFGTIFHYFILKVRRKYKKEYFKHQESFVSYEEIFEEKSSDSENDSGFRNLIPNDYIEKFDALNEMINSDEATLNFFKTLDDFQLSIVDELLQSKNMKEISLEKKLPYNKIYKEVKLIKEKANNYFNDGVMR